MSLPTERIYARGMHNLQHLQFPAETIPQTETYSKKTLMRSPLIVGVFPAFQVSLSKPLAGLASSSINDEDDQVLREPEKDSYFGADADEEMWDLQQPLAQPSPLEPAPSPQSSFASVEVLVRASSVVVADVEYALPAGVKAVALIPCTTAFQEDSLLISLLSGYLLLVRVWRVKRGVSDASFAEASRQSYSEVFRPFVVQWWSLSGREGLIPGSSSDPYPSSASSSGPGSSARPSDSGFSLCAHPAGLAVVSASAHSLFRIYSCQHTPAGLQLSPHFNVPINGVILASCFAHPLNSSDASNHILFLTLTLSTSKRLELSLYSWYAHEPLEGNLETSMLPLNNNFPFPVAIVPLANNNSFLLICPQELIIITINNIWSADYTFARFDYKGAFPTAVSIPASPILSADEDAIQSDLCDEVLLAAEDGVVYSLIVQDNKSLDCVPIIRVADPVSVFDLRPADGGYLLTFASDTGGAKKLLVPELFSQEEAKIPYTDAILHKDYKNWTPVVDVKIIDSVPSRSLDNNCSQELWVLSGLGRRSKLSHISSGYPVKKESSTLEAYRKSQALYTFDLKGTSHIACCMPFETKFLDIPSCEETSSLSLSGDVTLWCANVAPESVLQLTSKKAVIQTMRDPQSNEPHEGDFKTYTLDFDTILFAKSLHEWAVLIIEDGEGTGELENGGMLRLEVRKTHPSSENWFPLLHSVPASRDVSALSISEDETTLFVIIGTFAGRFSCMALHKLDNTVREVFAIDLNPLVSEGVVPHDILYFPDTSKAFIGSKCGLFLELNIQDDAAAVEKKLQLCSMPLRLLLSKRDPNLLIAYARNAWLFDYYESRVPCKVLFGDKAEKPIVSMVEVPADMSQHIRLVFVREDGLGVGSLFTHISAVVRQISVGEPAKKLAFLDTQGLFVVLSKSKNPLTRLKFADRKSYRMLPTVEFDSRSGAQRTEPIFAAEEYPTCSLIWKIVRGDRVSKKLIVGTQVEGKGNLKIIDISRVALDGTQATIIKQTELISIPRDQPVTCIEQLGSTILFACGPSIYSTAYKLESKKLKPVQTLVSLSSDVSFMSTADSLLLVNSKMDSLLVFRYTPEAGDMPDRLDVVFKDHTPRSLVNNSVLAQRYFAGDKLHSQLVVMDENGSSRYKLSMIPRTYVCGLASMWAAVQEHLVAVGVNGEVVSFKPETHAKISGLMQALASAYGLTPEAAFSDLEERLARPFLDKVTGKGFHNLNKPFFDFELNRSHPMVVDCDLDELSFLESGIVL